MKLENARKLVKPELLDEETDSQTDSTNERKNFDIEDEKKLENKLFDNVESTLGQESVFKPKIAKPKKNDERSVNERNKTRNFTPKSRNSSVKGENKKYENSPRNEKSRSTFNIRSKPKIENKVESNNSLGRGKSYTRRNKTNDFTTVKPRATPKSKEEKSKLPSRKPLVSRYRNAKIPSLSKSKISRGTTSLNQIKETTTTSNLIETTFNPVTMKNYIAVTRSVSSTISEEISAKKLRTKLFNDLSRSSVDETRLKNQNLNDNSKANESTTTKVFRPTSRYSRKKVQVSKYDTKDSVSIPKVNVTSARGGMKNNTEKIDPRSRTATYRRHSEVPLGIVRSSTDRPKSVEITPKATRFQVTSSPSPQLVTQEPTVNVKVSNESNSVQQQSLQIVKDDNTFTGNGSNIFSPTKNVLVTAGNVTLLEQIRSTVAPLLGSLAARSPIFSGVYNNASNIVRLFDIIFLCFVSFFFVLVLFCFFISFYLQQKFVYFISLLSSISLSFGFVFFLLF